VKDVAVGVGAAVTVTGIISGHRFVISLEHGLFIRMPDGAEFKGINFVTPHLLLYSREGKLLERIKLEDFRWKQDFDKIRAVLDEAETQMIELEKLYPPSRLEGGDEDPEPES